MARLRQLGRHHVKIRYENARDRSRDAETLNAADIRQERQSVVSSCGGGSGVHVHSGNKRSEIER